MPDQDQNPQKLHDETPADAAANSTPHDETAEITAEEVHAADPRDATLALLEEKWKRAVADLANYRRQAEEEKQNFAKYAAEKAVLAVLPTLDSLERSSQHCPADIRDSDYARGITAATTQLQQALASLGVEKIDSSIGGSVDPLAQQAIGTGPGASGEIIECFEEGYRLGGKVIRLAKVRVGDGSL